MNSLDILKVEFSRDFAAIVNSHACARQLIAFFRINNLRPKRIITKLPFKDYFSDFDIELIDNYDLHELNEYESILTSTSEESDVEMQFVEYAKSKQIKTYCMVDFWSNYKNRFLKNGILVLPDAIISINKTIDSGLKAIYKSKDLKFFLIEDPYIQELIDKSKLIKDSCNEPKEILFISQPFGHRGKDFTVNGISDLDNLDNLLLFIKSSDKYNKYKVRIRPHPSEDNSKFNILLSRWGEDFLHISSFSDILEDIVNSEIIIGTNSYALYIAYKLKKKVSYWLPSGMNFSIPVDSIQAFK